MYPRLVWNAQSSCFLFWSAGITGVWHGNSLSEILNEVAFVVWALCGKLLAKSQTSR